MLRRLLAFSVAFRRLRCVACLFAVLPVFGMAMPAAAQEPAEGDELAGMAAMPDLGLDWPDLGADEPQDPDEPAEPVDADLPPPEDDPEIADAALLARLDPAASLRYSTVVEGLGEAGSDIVVQRFDMLSALKAGERDTANIAQIRRRGQSDATLLDDLLRAEGYYDSRTALDFRAGAGSEAIVAVLAANPGMLFRLGAIDLDGPGELTADPALRDLFAIAPGDPAQIDRIKAATENLRGGLLERGYPFSSVSEPVLVVDHERGSATLNMTVETGGFRRIGQIRVDDGAPFGARHVAVISRFRPGDPYRQSDLADLDRALIATGLVSQVTIRPEPGAAADLVDLRLTLSKAPVHTIAGELGYGTGEGLRAEVSWQHRNFFPPEGALTLRGVLAEQEQSVSATLRRANFGVRDRVLNVQFSLANLDQPAYQARTVGISASFERQTNLIFQKDWTWSLGVELQLSDESDLYGADLVPRRRLFTIGALPTGINYDGSDDLLDPRRGFRLGLRLSPELSLQGGAFSYVRAQADGSFYIHASDRMTIAGRGRLGTIVGASRDRIAPTRRYYAGGGASVRGYSYQAIGPRDANNDPIGGRSLGEIALEARLRFGSQGQFGVVPFIDAGTISSKPWPGIKEMRVGAGLGFRYYSNFGPIRIDVGTPLNPQPGDSRVGVYVSLGQAF
jgi:translocation and assembly module TamA